MRFSFGFSEKSRVHFRRLTAGLLVFLFLITPILSVRAEEPAPTQGEEQNNIEQQQLTPEQSQEQTGGQEEPVENNGENSEPEAANPPEDPKLNPEKSPKRQLAQPDEATGALVYQYPFALAPGRNGMTPELSLTYNSQSNEKDSLVGQGWALSIPFIERVNKKGTNSMYTDNYFNSYADGELVHTSGDSYAAKVENGAYTKYTFSQNKWTVLDKNGTTYEYGRDTWSRQYDISDPNKASKWMLQEVKDTNGNQITYHYFKNNNQIYPDYIEYGHNTNNSTVAFVVTFTREARNDVTISYKTGFGVTTNERIKEVTVSDAHTTQWLKKYTLTYSSGDNTKTSLLTSITESGQDQNNIVTSLPAEQFEYQLTNPNTVHWTEDLTMSAPLEIRYDQSVFTMDVNGDGYEDIIQSHLGSNGQPTKRTFLGNANGGWTETTTLYQAPVYFGVSVSGSGTNDNGVRFSDVNGDGKIDILHQNGGESGIYLNNGAGWEETPLWEPPQSFITYYEDAPPAYIANINGDGLPDIIKTVADGSNIATYVYINTGDNWIQSMDWVAPRMINYSRGSMLADINGDGLDDLLESVSNSGIPFRKAYLNNGHGSWVENTGYEPPVNFVDRVSGPSIDYGVRFVDVNGDGLADILQASNAASWTGRSAYINTGIGWQANTKWEPMLNFYDKYPSQTPPGNLASFGKSLSDTFKTYNNGSSIETTAYLNNEKKVNLLKKVTLSTGGTIEATYQSTPLYKNGSILLNPELPMIIDTVATIVENDGNGVVTTNHYSYEGGLFYYNGPFDNKFAGFATVTKIDNSSKKISYYHQGNATNTQFGELDDHFSKIGKKYREEIYDLSGNKYTTVINRWDRADLGSGRNFVNLAMTINMVYDGNTSHKDTATAYGYDNFNGNILGITELGEVTAFDDGVIGDIGTDWLGTSFTYATNTSAGIIGLPKQEQTYDYFSQKVKEVIHYYDDLPLGQVNKGNETKTQLWRTGTKYIDTEKTYDSYGNAISEKDPRDKQTTYTYDSYNLYPLIVTNPLNQITSYEYDYSLGKPKRTIDPNGKSFYVDYDGLDRVVAERQPDINNPTSIVTKIAYEYPQSTTIIQKSYLDGGNIVDSYTYLDGLGRKIQEREEAADANQFNVRDFVYTSGDLLLKESLPYASSGSAKTAPTGTTNLYTTYSYDVLKRVVTAQTAVGTTSNAYDDWKTTVTDPAGKVKDIYRDAYDNLIRVDEHNGSSIYITTYEWSGLQKLKKITDALGNIRNFNYDGLGRVLSAEDLHAVGDSTFGTWSYAYDDSSNLGSRTDPNNVSVAYAYDDINRVLSEDANADGNAEVTYSYDTCNEGIGRLCSVNNGSVLITNTYDALGNINTQTKRIGRASFSSNYSYDRQGNRINITNPDGSQIAYSYDAAGRINQIQRKESNDPSFIDVISSISYNPVSLPTILNYANGAATTNTYDSNELYRLRTKITVAQGQNVQDLSYTYDPVGNITRIVDTSNTQTAKTVDYTYDDLHRLLSATISNSAAQNVDGDNNQNQLQTFSYDAIGNITYKSDVGSYSYNGNQGNSYANPHAVTSAGILNYEYDKNGNLILETSMMTPAQKIYTWDYNNRLLTVKTDTSVSNYAYDAGGQRIKAVEASGTTLYVAPEYTVQPTMTDKHIFLGDTAIASVRSGGLAPEVYNIHADHLTGSNVITDGSQNIDELTDYYAFGTIRIDQQNGSHAEKRKYTGHEYDEDTNLTYANARYYDAALGRWLNQDQIFIEITDSTKVEKITNSKYPEFLADVQGANGYSYVKNNPLKYIDVQGDWFKEFLTGKQSLEDFTIEIGDAANYLYNNSSTWKFIFDHPIISGGVIGLGSGIIVYYGAAGITYLTSTGIINFSQKFDPAAQQSNWLNEVKNAKVQNLIKDVFRATDKIPGGTIEALRKELATGELTGGKSHIIKAYDTINRIGNIMKSEKLNPSEIGKLNFIKDTLSSLLNSKK